jgi:hypothetical protein
MACRAAFAQALRCRRRHQPRRPPLAKSSPGRPAPAMGAGTLLWTGPRTRTPPECVEREGWLLPLRLSEYQRLIVDLLDGQEF